MFRNIKLKWARRIMRKALKDPGLRTTYWANIAMCIYDNRRRNGRLLNKLNCQEVAEKLIKVIFE